MIQGLSIVLLAASAAPSFAELPALDFDRAVPDVQAVVAEAKAEAKKDKDVADAHPAYYHADRDCVNFSFAPEGPALSDAVWLRSTEYQQQCTWVGGTPQQGGHQICHEVPMWTHTEKTQVELVGRKELFPWEREVFTVCLEGRWLSIHEVQAAHKYGAAQHGGLFTLTAQERKPMAPDRDGISAEAPTVVPNGIAVVLKDKWPKQHAGEKVSFKLALREDVPNWFDPTLLERVVEFDVAESYSVDFSKYASELQGKLKPGKKYYFDWGFVRLGKVSTNAFVKKGDTSRVVYSPKLLAAL